MIGGLAGPYVSARRGLEVGRARLLVRRCARSCARSPDIHVCVVRPSSVRHADLPAGGQLQRPSDQSADADLHARAGGEHDPPPDRSPAPEGLSSAARVRRCTRAACGTGSRRSTESRPPRRARPVRRRPACGGDCRQPVQPDERSATVSGGWCAEGRSRATAAHPARELRAAREVAQELGIAGATASRHARRGRRTTRRRRASR